MASLTELSHTLKLDAPVIFTDRGRHDFSDTFQDLKTIFKATTAELQLVMEKVNARLQQLEKESLPPGGYELHIINYEKTSPNRLEFYLEACEKREAGTEIKLPPAKNPCTFDDPPAEKLFACEQPTDKRVAVMKSNQGKPLVVPKEHVSHWILVTSNLQAAMTKAAEAAVKRLNEQLGRKEDAYSHLRVHVGIPGHQLGVAHVHMHIDV